jgi:hypothetical protein
LIPLLLYLYRTGGHRERCGDEQTHLLVPNGILLGLNFYQRLKTSGVEPQTLDDYIRMCGRISSPDFPIDRLVNAAIKLCRLEEKLGKPYGEALRELEGKMAELKEAELKMKRVQERTKELEGNLERVKEQLKKTIDAHERLRKLGLDEIAALRRAPRRRAGLTDHLELPLIRVLSIIPIIKFRVSFGSVELVKDKCWLYPLVTESMRPYSQWLNDLRGKIIASYDRYRIDKEIADLVKEVSKPQTVLPKGSGQPFLLQRLGPHGDLPEPYTYSTQVVTAYPIGISCNLPKGWADEHNIMDGLMDDIGLKLALREAQVILSGLEKADTRFEPREQGKVTRDDILRAAAAVRQKGFLPDAVVLDPIKGEELLLKGELVEAWRLRGFKKETAHYAGMVAGLDVYWTPVAGNNVFVYDKSYVIVARTQISVKFDNIEHPTKLIVDCWCSSAPVDPRAVARTS